MLKILTEVPKNYLVLLCFALVIGGLRMFMPSNHQLSLPAAYQAIAHIFVGVLFGYWLASVWENWFYGSLASVLTVLELVVFFAR